MPGKVHTLFTKGWNISEAANSTSGKLANIKSCSPKIGCIPETLRVWVRQAEKDSGARDGATSAERDKIKELEREVRQLRQANEILRKASAYFAQAELDRPFKP